MLFSHPEIVETLSRDFECAWESLRPVPRATIDFGNRRVLERTLRGNVATLFTRSDGVVLDAVPGLVDAAEYLSRLDQARSLHGRLKATPASALADALAEHHGALLASQEGGQPLLPADLSKFLVEQPVVEAVRPPPPTDSLAADTVYNREHRYPKARALLARGRLHVPATITRELFAEVLHVDLDDPYLGLAPEVLGGEVGRR